MRADLCPLLAAIALACGGGTHASAVDRVAGDTASVAGPALPAGCAELPSEAVLVDEMAVQTEEDFDFGPDGRVVYQIGSAVVGTDRAGTTITYGSGITGDPSGIQVAPDGNLVVCGQDSGAVYRVDVATGGIVTLFSGLIRPNGLEVGSDGAIYVSEFTTDGAVRAWVDGAGTDDVVPSVELPNGIALSPDGERLYFVGMRPSGKHTVFAVDREEHGWGRKTGVYARDEVLLDGVETDACGNVYVVDYRSGAMLRIDPDGGPPVTLITLNGGHFSSLRWGSGVGGWDPDLLYVTDRVGLYGIDVGAPGRPPAWAR